MKKKSKVTKLMVEKQASVLDRLLDDYGKDKIETKDNNNSNSQLIKDNQDHEKGDKSSTIWKSTDYILIFNPFKLTKNTEKTFLLSFDLDGTIINTNSGKAYALNSNDWSLFGEGIDEIISNKLLELPKLLGLKANEAKEFSFDKAALVIFSNQAGLGKGYLDKKMFKEKIEKVFARLTQKHKLESLWFFSSDEGYYRKPSVGMFEYLKEHYYPNIKSEYSIYVGDAAGRPAKNERSKDHSDTDYKFALNLGIKFFTPEEFYYGTKERIPKFPFDPREFRPIKSNESLNNDNSNNNLNKDEASSLLYLKELSTTLYEDIKSKNQIVIIFVGSAGSGKSSFYFNHFKNLGFERINNDTLKTERNCLKKLDKCLNEKLSAVIDNTNPGKSKRKVFINPCKDKNVKVYCLYFDYSKDLVMHLNNERKILMSLQSTTNVDLNYSEPVGKVIIHTFFKNVEIPEKEEGFEEVITVKFVPGPFPTPLHEKVFYMLS